MKSILSVAAVVLLGASHVAAEYPAAALAYRQLNALVYEGCYSSSTGLSKNSSYKFQSKGYCQTVCAPLKKAVQATSNSDECWCGDEVPPSSDKVDDSKCSSSCTGYGIEMCGGDGFFSVYLTGTTTDVPNAVSSGSASSGSSPKSSATTSASPSVVTIGGQTVVVTAAPSGSSSTSGKSSSGGSNKAAIAAGVVVGIVAIAAIAGGAFLFLRHRRRRAVEEEYRRNAAVSSFIGGGKPPTSSGGGSSFTDTRLDASVMAQRRMSDGSIADNQDYSRRILKVTNA